MTPEQAYAEYDDKRYNVGYTQWGTVAKHGKVKSIGHPKSFSRACDSKLALGGAWGSQAYHFTNMKPNMRGAKALKFIAEHPGYTRREILDGIGLPPNYFSNFFTALKKTDLLDTTMSEKNSYTLTRKGEALVDDIFNSPLNESTSGKIFKSILNEGCGNCSEERLAELYRKLLETFDDLDQDGDYESMSRVILDALHDSNFSTNFLICLGKKFASRFQY